MLIAWKRFVWRAARALRASTAFTCPKSTLLRDVRQRHARGDDLPDEPVGECASIAQRPGGTRVHPVEVAP